MTPYSLANLAASTCGYKNDQVIFNYAIIWPNHSIQPKNIILAILLNGYNDLKGDSIF